MPRKKSELRMIPSDSECVKAFGYQDSKKKLTINFRKDDTIYEFLDVPYTKFLSMCEASSLGTFFRKEIQGKFSSDKISD